MRYLMAIARGTEQNVWWNASFGASGLAVPVLSSGEKTGRYSSFAPIQRMRLEIDYLVIDERVLIRCSYMNLSADKTTFADQKHSIGLRTFANRPPPSPPERPSHLHRQHKQLLDEINSVHVPSLSLLAILIGYSRKVQNTKCDATFVAQMTYLVPFMETRLAGNLLVTATRGRC